MRVSVFFLFNDSFNYFSLKKLKVGNCQEN